MVILDQVKKKSPYFYELRDLLGERTNVGEHTRTNSASKVVTVALDPGGQRAIEMPTVPGHAIDKSDNNTMMQAQNPVPSFIGSDYGMDLGKFAEKSKDIYTSK
jgi:hypothetical protein